MGLSRRTKDPGTVETVDPKLERLVKRIQTDPVWFATQVLNLRALPGEPSLKDDPKRSWELDQFQKDLLNAMSDVVRRRNGMRTMLNHEGLSWFSVSAMHGPGKTFTAALVSHWFNTGFPGRVIVTGPKFKQLTTRFMPEFRKIRDRAETWYRSLVAIDATKAQWCGKRDWELLLETAKNPENLAGHHHRYLLIIVEEATGVPETLWPVIFGALSTGEYVMLLMISNPTRRTGTFARSHLSSVEAPDYFRMQLSLDKTKRVSRPWAEKMRRRYGERSPIYKIRVLGQFANDDANQLISTEWITEAFLVERENDGSQPKLRVSVDVGDGGEDSSVCTACHHFDSFIRGKRQEQYSFPAATASQDTADAAEALFDQFAGRKGIDDFVVDATGVGTGVAGELMKRGHRVIRYKGGEASSNPKLWKNRRTQTYMVLRDNFRDRLICLDDDFIDDRKYEGGREEFEAQLCSVKRKFSGDDKFEELVTRAEMRREGVPSPDRADSMAMQVATDTPAVMPQDQKTSAVDRELTSTESGMFEGY